MSKARLAALAVLLLAAPPLLAGFTGTDLVIAATARAAGRAPSQFYSTLWVTNLSGGSQAQVTYTFLQQGQVNTSPSQKTETLMPGETRKYENVVSSLFGKDGVAGAIRIQSDRELLASSRTYDQPQGADLRDVKGLFFGAVPSSFAIALGETAQLQGVTQGSAEEDYRYNFGFVELAGAEATVRVTLYRGNGVVIASKEYAVRGAEAFQLNVGDLLGSASTSNGRLEATVIAGNGKVLVYGTQIANGSQDSAGFEMSFKSGLLAANTQSSAEQTAAAGAATVTDTISRASDIGPRLSSGRQPLADSYSAGYSESTGFWHITFTTPAGQSADLQVQFRDGQGQVQKIYNPLTTTTILVRGSASGPQGHATFDVTMVGGRTSSTFTANGSGTVTYQGSTGELSVNNVVIPKQQPAYPTSGSVVCVVNGITITITFNGTQYASGTYQYRNQSFTFTVDLKTGEVSKP